IFCLRAASPSPKNEEFPVITDGVLMLGVLLGLSGLLIVLERTTGWKLFRFVPGMVLMYLLCATLNSLGVFGQDDATREPIAQVKDVLLPAMILLFLFGCDLRKIIRLGPKLLLTMFVASASLFASMIGVYAIFQGFLHSDAWKVFGALLASWTGGSANLVSLPDMVQTPEYFCGYALMTDTPIYSVWLLLRFASAAVSPRFSRGAKADTSSLDPHGREADDEKRPVTATLLAIVILRSILV